MPRRPPQHRLGFPADGDDLIRRLVDGDDRRLVDDDALMLDIDKDIRRTQVDGDIAAQPVCQGQ